MGKDTVQQYQRRRKPPQLQPLQQGNLDGLCGIYSIINAIRYLCKEFKHEESFALFHFLIGKAAKHGNLNDIITQGLTPKEFKRLLKSALKWLKREYNIKIKQQRCRHKKSNRFTLKTAWQDFSSHLSKKTVILIGFTGKHNHYSVITGITAKTLVTFDSSKMQLIRKSQCSTGYTENKYCIERKEVFFLTRKV
jgi:hypothetical protein